ncbi:hypothetical protein [Tahibacter amnicola]|uniref:Uncharacterized protein n=1 Tax=Tahibacter amnicola TaxID=2976241 RepID=A0ABY6B725_9GAMM|nr:hypothetical protein [Tahibacter amnicola]UXI65903.1 hypothetical protein N4264_14165 [Tahibacter amnicola]
MKSDHLLSICSAIAVVLMSLHLTDDILRGFEPGGLGNLRGMLILAVWLYAALVLVGTRLGYTLLLLGSLFAAVVPALHLSGAGVGGKIAQSDGGYFFIWILYGLGVTGGISLILTLHGLWRSWRNPAQAA